MEKNEIDMINGPLARKILVYSDRLCAEAWLRIIEKKEYQGIYNKNKYQIALKGKSWKIKLANAIDYSLEKSKNKSEFFKNMNKLGYTIPTLEVNCKYKYHITSGDIITIEPKITEFNGVRMTVTYNVIDKKTENIVINAWTKHCFTDKTLRPINIKKKNEKIYTIFEKLLEEGIKTNK